MDKYRIGKSFGCLPDWSMAGAVTPAQRWNREVLAGKKLTAVWCVLERGTPVGRGGGAPAREEAARHTAGQGGVGSNGAERRGGRPWFGWRGARGHAWRKDGLDPGGAGRKGGARCSPATGTAARGATVPAARLW
jgi:hypothetical protein